MKNTASKLSALAALIALAVIPTFAHPGGHAQEPSEERHPAKPSPSAEKLPETAAEILKTIDAQQALLTAALDDEKWNVVQAQALTVNRLVQHLVTRVPADHQTSVKEIAARHDQLTADIVKSSAAGARKQTEANTAKLSGNLRALKTQAH